MRPRNHAQSSAQSPPSVRQNRAFSDAAARALPVAALLALACAATGCVKHPRIGGPGSPLHSARIDAVLPPNPPTDTQGHTARLLFECPEYSRRDRDLGLRR